MLTQYVTSSFIDALSYDEDKELLIVWIADRGPYEYQGVDPDTYQEFVEAASKGQFFNAEIKPTYDV